MGWTDHVDSDRPSESPGIMIVLPVTLDLRSGTAGAAKAELEVERLVLGRAEDVRYLQLLTALIHLISCCAFKPVLRRV